MSQTEKIKHFLKKRRLRFGKGNLGSFLSLFQLKNYKTACGIFIDIDLDLQKPLS